MNPRACGYCTLCCKVMAIEQLAKPVGRWCTHCNPGRGCLVYPDRPAECRSFSCMWLVNELLGRTLEAEQVQARPDDIG